MGELIIGKKLLMKTPAGETKPTDNAVPIPKTLVPLLEQGFLHAHYTASEVRALVAGAGDFEQYLIKPAKT